MDQAIAIAKAAFDSSECPVGCAIALSDAPTTVVAVGANKTVQTHNATQHAEFVALESFLSAYPRDALRHAIFYVTVEPCVMCASLLSMLQVKEVRYGCHNARFGGVSSTLRVATSGLLPDGAATSFLHTPEDCRVETVAVDMLKQFYSQENLGAPEGMRKRRREVS